MAPVLLLVLIANPQNLSFTYPSARNITITNTGSTAAEPLSFTTTSLNFSVNGSACTALQAGASCTIPVTFNAPTVGNYSGTLIVGTSSQPNALQVPLTGTLSPPTLAANPAELNFPVSPSSRTVTLMNTGSLPTGALTKSVPSTVYNIVQDNCLNLGFSQSCSITIAFNSANVGNHNGVLTISSSGLQNPFTVPLVAIVSPSTLTATPQSLTFTQNPSNLLISFTNTGGVPTGPLSKLISGPHASKFGISQDTCTSLLPGTNCTLRIGFTSGTVGDFNATLTLTGSNGNYAPIALTADLTRFEELHRSLP